MGNRGTLSEPSIVPCVLPAVSRQHNGGWMVWVSALGCRRRRPVAKETAYKSYSWTFDSKGLMSRPSTDRPPDAHFFQNMNGILEREESACSTRYGSTIVNRSPSGSGTSNFPLPSQPVTLARLLGLSGASYRYAGLADGTLWRIAGTTQGPYAEIASGLSGKQFTALVTTTFGSSLPFEFIFDRTKMIKDSGTGSPTGIGISPPTRPVAATQYAPQIYLIESFAVDTGYGPSNMTPVSSTTAFTVAGTGGTSVLSGNYNQYTDSTGSYAGPPDGMIATSTNL